MSLLDDKPKSISEQADEPRRAVVVPLAQRIKAKENTGLGGRSTGLQGVASSIETGRQQRVIVEGRVTGPVQLLNQILDEWALSSQHATNMLGYESSDVGFVEDILRGVVTLSGRDVKDRVAYLITIYNLLNKLFGHDKKVVNEWLHKEQPKLNRSTPISYITSGSMERLLHVKYLVDLMAGQY